MPHRDTLHVHETLAAYRTFFFSLNRNQRQIWISAAPKDPTVPRWSVRLWCCCWYGTWQSCRRI